MNKNYLKILLNGLIKENPVLVLVLGTCPSLATTTNVTDAVGMGIAATLVLICSNIVISALRNIIPDKVRIPCYIVVIAGFVTVVEMLLHAFVPSLYDSLGVFLSLIVVNCIILGRAEMFANKNNVVASAFDGIGMGLGFTLALFAMATIREVLGTGSFCGISIPILRDYCVPILRDAPGGFFVFGVLIAIVAAITGKQHLKGAGCAGCPSAALCGKLGNCAQAEQSAEQEEGTANA